MAIFNLYSKRQKALRGEIPDVYTYDALPRELKVQIIFIVEELYPDDVFNIWDTINKTLCKEYGIFDLNGVRTFNAYKNVKIFFLETENIELNIDVIELVFRVFFKLKGRFPNNKVNDAINELNDRFKEHAVGYQFEEGKIIRVDSTYMHSEVVKPTLWLLSHPKFTGANNEFLNAHEHYRSGRNKECLISCTKAIESTMKIICEEKGWEYDRQKDTLAKLVQICFNNGLLPEYIQNQFTSLPSLLSTGVSVIRNKTSAHGDGVYPQSVDDDLTRYGLNLTGSNIIFLIKQSKLI